MLLSTIAIVVSTIAAMILFSHKIRLSSQWRATVTPLASIIGSGFLIVAPLLHSVMGKWALLGMVILSIFAYSLGGIIRFNIRYAEEYISSHEQSKIAKLEVIGQWFLGGAYAISVAFYISLFSAFIFDQIGVTDTTTIKLVTTVMLLAIMTIAWLRGAKGLEIIELYAVTIKLAIIVGVLIALLSYDISTGTAWFQHGPIQQLSYIETLSILAGMLMVTQGFETTRFMGSQYSVLQRIKAVKYSQSIAIVLYILFIGLTCPIFLTFPIVELNETTISHTLGQAVWILPFLLLIAATASQLSAALADTIGGGGLLKELMKFRLSANIYYMLIVMLAIALVWSADVFQIINFASKGFALYYLVQALVALLLLYKQPQKDMIIWLKISGIVLIIISLVLIIGWSIPAPHN